jgi:hypothetical protein
MLKKLTTKQDQKIEAKARAKFATDIIELYHAQLARKPATHPDPDVRAVASGLVALKQAIAPFLHQHRNDAEALVYTGVVMADGIIDALTTGQGHPLWKHIDALKTETYRPGRVPGVQEMRIREMLAGVVLAYQETAGVDQWKAARAVAEGIKSQDFPFTAGQLRQWARRGNSAAVRTYADKFLADADEQAFRCFFLPAGKIMPPEIERILIVGREALFPLIVKPS